MKWEYLVEIIKHAHIKELEDQLNIYGNNNWQACDIKTIDNYKSVVIFKRQKDVQI